MLNQKPSVKDTVVSKIKKGAKWYAGQSKTVFTNTYQSAPVQGKALILLVILILAIIVLYAIGMAVTGVVGFFTSAYGIAVLIFLVLAVGLYMYLKMSGVIDPKKWYISLIMIGVIFFMLIVFVGAMPFLQETFIELFPFILIGAVGYGAYKFIRGISNDANRTIAIIITIAIVILVPISQMFIVPAVYGHPMRVDAYIMRDSSGDIHAKITGGEWGMFLSATTTLNPMGATIYGTSRTMWYMGTYQKYYYTITVTDYYGKILFRKDMAQVVLMKSDYIHDVGLFYLPNSRYYDVGLEITVYSEDGVSVVAHGSAELSNLYQRG